MANIRVDVNYKIADGSEVVFRSPVDCSQITGLIVYYPGEDGNTASKVFALSDAHGNNVGDIDHLFAENVVVKVILDVTAGMAFVQNADTNAYLEAKFAALLPKTELNKAINEALAEAKESGDFDGGAGRRGASLLVVTTAPTGYTTEVNGLTPSYRIALSTVKTQASTAEVFVGDTVLHSYNCYPVIYVDSSYVYFGTRVSIRGPAGKDGTSVTVSSVSENTEDGGSNVVTFSDGNTLSVKNGKKGDSIKGDPGKDGKTPVRGVDYYTESDKAEFSTYIASELSKRGQLKPEFANRIEDCTDTSKLYVLPDGYIYAYAATETEGSKTPNFTNLMDGAGAYVKDGYRYSQSSAAFKEYAAGTSLVFPYNAPAGTHVFRIRGGIISTSYSASFYLGDTNQSFPHTRNQTVKTDSNGDVEYTTTSSTEINGYLCICIEGVTDLDSIIVTLNEEITYTITEGGVSYKWANTGRAFVPADYEPRILEIEKDVTAQAKQISSLESKVENINADASIEAAYNRIKNWQYPIYEDAPVFLLETNKPALTASDMTTAGVYAKYDALMAANPHYITKVNCGMASDGTTPIYAYHFRQPNPHYLHNSPTQWTEKKPTFLVCSGVHPLEQTGAHSMFHALEEITTNPELFDLKRNLHIIVFPMLNPTAFEDDRYHMRNPDGVQVHHNFEVGHGENGAAQGDRYYGGATPLSIPETQYFDAVMDAYKDSLVCVLSCHNNELDERHGTGVIWCSCATQFTCNLGFRFADKMSIAWREKHGAEVFDAGIRWANDFVLAQYENPTISDFEWMFDIITPERQEDWDYLVGRSNMSGSGGTEYRQGTKYGIHGVNVETCPRCMILDRDYNATNTSNAITMGTETYINYFRTFMAAYDPKDKKDYAPNLPWKI